MRMLCEILGERYNRRELEKALKILKVWEASPYDEMRFMEPDEMAKDLEHLEGFVWIFFIHSIPRREADKSFGADMLSFV
jgi:hypothetical protein